MPIYEYQREDGTVFEITQSIKDDALEVCPETGQKVKKLISKNSFKLNGSGWYQTDYASGSSTSGSSGSDSSSNSDSSSSSSEKDSSSDSSSSESSSSDSKKPASCGTKCGCH